MYSYIKKVYLIKIYYIFSKMLADVVAVLNKNEYIISIRIVSPLFLYK